MAEGVKPHELIQLCKLLDSRFKGKIVGTGHKEIDKERNFYTKALAAYYLTQEAGASDEEAIKASIDGGLDHGIDSVYVDTTQTVWLIQSKYKDSGTGEIELAEVGKFVDGVKDLTKQKYERFNKHLHAKIPLLNAAFDSGVANVKAVLTYTGSALGDDKRRVMSDLETALNQPADPMFLRFLIRGLASFHRMQLDEQLPAPITAEITLENYGHIDAPYMCYFGSISGAQLKALKISHGEKLFDANIRHFQGDTVANQDISSTIRENPEHFFYFNNGVTFICDAIRPIGPRDDTRSSGKFRVENLSVINGAQTVSSLAVDLTGGDEDCEVKVLATFIALEADLDEFGGKVTRYRNNQNAVSDIDFAALDENQVQWSQTLQQSGVAYRYKSGELDQEDFDVETAAKALACWVTDSECNLIAQAKKDSKKLFSRVSGKGVHGSAYHYLFKDSLQARQLWRIVQIHQLIRDSLKSDARQATGIEKEITSNALMLLCHIVYIKAKQHIDHNDLQLSLAHSNVIRSTAQSVTQIIIAEYQKINWGKNPASVFKNATDLKTLKGAVMAAQAKA
ncbi:AIPR family protein [Pseudoalteromonas piscicida]|uniref:Abortive phage infection protein C-terminal domain-containing protein n=1 Tax=Pseudoalteromonas piscicida TaxID=43662 RepID=A0ABN5CEE2_PSEO7|nr:AIPR family protein [Pseudoalteromonas piscicida]ATD07929.1 hypothetical protein PPIS_a3076 [Pseudoalteromonas piscicida]WPU34509.1 AIPR family protein [Pseudoalteromonas piscicida]